MNVFRINNSNIIPILPDDCQVNPNTYGFELAYWLCSKLAQKGIIFSYPNHEDWGWFIEQSDGDRELWLCCKGEFNDNKFQWSFYLKEKTGLFGRRKYKDHEVKDLETKIIKLFNENNILPIEEID